MLCKICNQIEYDTKTIDNEPICKGCYDEVHQEIFKGLFTLNEGLEAIFFKQEYKTSVNKYLIILKKNSIKLGVLPETYIAEIMCKENDLALKIFNKTRDILKRDEHLVIINAILEEENLGNIVSLNSMNNMITEYVNKYLYGMVYIYD